jgi:hypothetical protein
MAAKTASLSVNIIADAAKAKSGLKEAETAFGKFRREVGASEGAIGKFKTTSSAALNFVKSNAMNFAAAAGAAIVAFGVSSVKAASKLEESINALQVTFGVASNSLLEFSKNSAMTVGMSAADFNSFAVQFAGFATKVGKSSVEVSDIIKGLAVRTADFASVMNIEVADAARVFQSALAGETEPIKKFGIDMSAAAVEAFALATGLAKTKGEITETVKQQARLGLLLKETNKVAGDFKNTQDGLANSSRTLKAQFEDLQAAAGQRLTPALAEVLSGVVALVDGFEDLNLVIPGTGGKGFFDFVSAAFKMPFNIKGAIKDLYGDVDQASTSMQGFGYETAEVNRATVLLDRVLGDATREIEKQKRAVDLAIASWDDYKKRLNFQNEFSALQEQTEEFEVYWAEAMKNGTANAAEVQRQLNDNKLALLGFAEQILVTASIADRNRIRIKVETGEITTAIGLMNELLRAANVAFAKQGDVIYAATPFGSQPTSGGVYVDGVYIPPGIDFSKLANGKIVSGPEIAMIGEAGAEAVIPLTRPARAMELMQASGLDMLAMSGMRSGGGGSTTIVVNVQAGLVSSPDQVGQQIIDAIRRAERRSGQVFAAA